MSQYAYRNSDTSDTVPELPLSLSHSEVVQEQCNDVSLKEIFERVLPASEISNVATGYFLHNSLLIRKWVPVSEDGVKNDVYQIVFPTKFCSLVLKVAHDECGHFGVRKTYLNILKHFFWPWMKRDVSAYIKTCHVCQLTGKRNQTVKPAPLQPTLTVSEPFTHLIVDMHGSAAMCQVWL
ncbi:Pro-Pol polyprotein [Merluccius polli]|uniref:Gypsy retrotransposon integrase-like protein 1 n=1 Tax=Merluccius polli TaxID=89951 RepID=A0AA47N8H3_MERPO|nr:Pro-Pol polyprotein [Merluccius polli]